MSVLPGDIADMTEQELHVLENAVRNRRLELATVRRRGHQAERLSMGEPFPFGAGDIGTFCRDLVFHAQRIGAPVSGEFNGMRLTASPKTDASELCATYCARRS